MKKYFLSIAKTALVLVYLVIVAGALVRMTGSGMGCPDWPKCFGYYIPPTELKQLLFTAGKEYNKGQIIIKNETLFVAKTNFKATATYNSINWEKYAKHDYAIFNVQHTWIEYINRLLGALAGLACLVMAIGSFWYFKSNIKITVFSWIVVLMMGFQAWLGKTVVDSVLSPFKITTHVLVALLIVALLLYIIKKCSVSKPVSSSKSKFNLLLWLALFLSIIQITMGTQVRQHIDAEIKNGVTASVLWLQNPTLIFYLHRSFSVLVFVVNGYLFIQNQKLKLGFAKMNWVLVLIGAEIITGIAMYYFDFPFASQPIHLVLASLLFGFQWYLVLESQNKRANNR